MRDRILVPVTLLFFYPMFRQKTQIPYTIIIEKNIYTKKKI